MIKKNLTLIIVIALILLFTGFFVSLLVVTNIRSSASTMFQNVDSKIKEFDRLNYLSKQEMEKDIIKSLDEVISKYSYTAEGKKALFYKGYIYYNVNKYDEAVKQFKLFTSKYEKNYITPKAYYLMSYSYNDNGKKDEAINTLKEIENYKESHYYPLALVRIGELYEKESDIENALKYFNKVIEECPDSEQKSFARKKVVMIENKIEL